MPTDNKSTHSDAHINKKQNAKLAQVVQNFFTKSAQIILQSRSYPETNSLYFPQEDTSTQKLNKWFNIYSYAAPDFLREELRLWTGDLSFQSVLPPMIIETYLDLRQLPSNQIVVVLDENNNPWTVGKSGGKKHEIVLERWLIEFDQKTNPGSIIDELPLIYKQAIILFRSIYGFARLMPGYKLKKKLQSSGSKLVLGNRILDGNQPISSKGRIGLSKSIIPQQMLTTESHMTQKMFQPIHTSLGSLKISIAYRNHYEFCLHENEEVLSTHFISIDNERQQQEQHVVHAHHHHVNQLQDTEEESEDQQDKKISSSLSPCSSSVRESSSPQRAPSKPIIQPFKVGSISNSPPTSSLERRVSITSNKSTSNASLAAFLRNPRSSTPATANIPIANSNSIGGGGIYGVYNSSFPKSIGSSVGHEDSFVNPDSTNNTPRFSSSFGSRASRRFSNTSIKQQTPDVGNVDANFDADDDISDFVRMIDSKSDLRFSTSSFAVNEINDITSDSLNKFQMLKSQHQQLGDSVNASLILHHPSPAHTGGVTYTIGGGSRHSSRKSSLNSPPASVNSYEQRMAPPQYARIKETSPRIKGTLSDTSSNKTPTPSIGSDKNKHISNSATATATPAPTPTPRPTIKSPPTTVISGLATSPSIYYGRSSIRYEDVFDDEEEVPAQQSQQQSVKPKESPNKKHEEDDDDLLFTMSDMNSK
ncbi:Autophagy-related protein 13 [Spathaspora sp. JA1]|nr:Autophagy-related protein 13 [Spathaspora sp. JA1]